jgi:hypothetical protein
LSSREAQRPPGQPSLACALARGHALQSPAPDAPSSGSPRRYPTCNCVLALDYSAAVAREWLRIPSRSSATGRRLTRGRLARRPLVPGLGDACDITNEFTLVVPVRLGSTAIAGDSASKSSVVSDKRVVSTCPHAGRGLVGEHRDGTSGRDLDRCAARRHNYLFGRFARVRASACLLSCWLPKDLGKLAKPRRFALCCEREDQWEA